MKKYPKKFAAFLARKEVLYFENNSVNLDFNKLSKTKLNALSRFYYEMLVDCGLSSDLNVVVSFSKNRVLAQIISEEFEKSTGTRVPIYYFLEEQGKEQGYFLGDAFFDKCNILIVDYLSSQIRKKKEELCQLHKEACKKNYNVNIAVCVDMEEKDSDTLPVFSISKISNIVNYLTNERKDVKIDGVMQPIPFELKREFNLSIAKNF